MEICHVMPFFAVQFFFGLIYYAFAEVHFRLFCARLKGVTFEFAEKRLEHLESGEMLCVHRSIISTASTIRGCKILRECIQCLYNKLIDCLFVAQKSINYWTYGKDVAYRYQSRSYDRSPNCALNVPTCITSRGELKKTSCVFWSSTSWPCFLLWNQLCLV